MSGEGVTVGCNPLAFALAQSAGLAQKVSGVSDLPGHFRIREG
ncbi:hypothetical protein AA103587_2615 [Gluconobacter kanchanaburiensis NBRC 103587]|nr:hypothetical protein AA103587_2615 [Gluconobacter kanchanaburiensis NBRC 103587]